MVSTAEKGVKSGAKIVDILGRLDDAEKPGVNFKSTLYSPTTQQTVIRHAIRLV